MLKFIKGFNEENYRPILIIYINDKQKNIKLDYEQFYDNLILNLNKNNLEQYKHEKSIEICDELKKQYNLSVEEHETCFEECIGLFSN